MKKYFVLVGIDVSKSHLDSYVMAGIVEEHKRFENTRAGIRALIKHASSIETSNGSEVLFCMEHTGVYAMPLCNELADQELDYALVPAIEIKRSMGLKRGKNDKADAKAIAKYALLHQHEIKLYSLPEKALLKLKLMLSHRERLLEARKTFMVAANETKSFLEKDICKEVTADSNRMVVYFNKKIEKIEKSIMEVISNDQELKKTYDLVTSVPGVGMQIALSLIVTTRCFSAFKDSRQMACYAGVAPFEYRSGSIIINHDHAKFFGIWQIKKNGS